MKAKHLEPKSEQIQRAQVQPAKLTKNECEFNLGSFILRAKRWRSETVRNIELSNTLAPDKQNKTTRIIALHGWLDNAASFDFLIPDLIHQRHCRGNELSDEEGLNDESDIAYNHYDVVALDLAGHGRSDQRPGLGAYNIWQDVFEIILVANTLGWDRFHLLGHSRGAMICTMLAGSFPERVSGLVLIEALTPQSIPATDLPKQLAASVESLTLLRAKKRNYYKTFEQAVLARAKGFFNIPVDAARALAKRGVTEVAEGHYWNSDARLLAPSEIKLTEDQTYAFVDRFPVNAKVIVASDGLVNTPENLEKKVFKHKKIEVVHREGDHHLHLTASSEARKTIAKDINEYYENLE